jgi:hypothetical protein
MSTERTIRVAFYDSEKDNVPKVEDLTFPAFAKRLATHRRTPCGSSCVGHDCPQKLGLPAFSCVDIEGTRANEHVKAVTGAVFDLDGASEAAVSACDKLLEESGIGYIYYSTHSHREGAQSFRIVMPLSRPVTPSEWPMVRQGIIDRFKIPADPNTKVARIYFEPSAPEALRS